jgi:hypothetical protein
MRRISNIFLTLLIGRYLISIHGENENEKNSKADFSVGQACLMDDGSIGIYQISDKNERFISTRISNTTANGNSITNKDKKAFNNATLRKKNDDDDDDENNHDTLLHCRHYSIVSESPSSMELDSTSEPPDIDDKIPVPQPSIAPSLISEDLSPQEQGKPQLSFQPSFIIDSESEPINNRPLKSRIPFMAPTRSPSHQTSSPVTKSPILSIPIISPSNCVTTTENKPPGTHHDYEFRMEPKLPECFLNTKFFRNITYSLSIAIPSLPGKSDVDPSSIGFREKMGHSGSEDADRHVNPNDEYDSEDEKYVRHAHSFQRVVSHVIVDIAREFANITILKGPFQVRRKLQFNQSSDYSKSINEDGVTSENRLLSCDLLLVESIQNSNFTKINTLRGNIEWWKYTMSYLTDEKYFMHVNQTLFSVLAESLQSGYFLAELKENWKKVEAVCQPGQEAAALRSGVNNDNDWSFNRWLGLGIFIVTSLSFLVLTRTAVHRRKKMEEAEKWGLGVATEEDINRILAFGWEYDGQYIYTFDKLKCLYQDDDSVLLGDRLPKSCDIHAALETESSNEVSRTQETTGTTPSSGICTLVGSSENSS